MKKGLTTALLIAAITLTACEKSPSTMTSTEKEEITVSTAESTTVATTTAIPTTAPTTEETTTSAIGGSRSKPALVGEIVGMNSDVLAIGVVVNSVTRGEEAKNIAMDANQFNEIPEGKEVIIANVTFMLFKYDSADDSSWVVSSYDFDYFNLNFAEIDRGFIIVPDELSGEMYAGAELTGNICVLADEGTNVYARLYDNFWFDISGL